MPVQLPTIRSYGDYSSSNYGAHTLEVNLPGLTLYFSYQTVIAYHDLQEGEVVSKNVWGKTTGKHLNFIDNGNKADRLPHDEFERRLAAVLERRGYTTKEQGA